MEDVDSVQMRRIELLIGLAETKKLGPVQGRELLNLVRELAAAEYKRGEEDGYQRRGLDDRRGRDGML